METSSRTRAPRRRLRTAWALIPAACLAAFFFAASPRTQPQNAPARPAAAIAGIGSHDSPSGGARHLRPGEARASALRSVD